MQNDVNTLLAVVRLVNCVCVCVGESADAVHMGRERNTNTGRCTDVCVFSVCVLHGNGTQHSIRQACFGCEDIFGCVMSSNHSPQR